MAPVVNYWRGDFRHAAAHALTLATETAVFCVAAYVAGFCFTRGTLRAYRMA